MLHLGYQDQVRLLADHRLQILQPQGELIDPHHPLGPAEIDHGQGVAYEDARGILVVRVDRVLQVEDDAVGFVQPGVDEILRFVPRNVEPGAAHTVARGGRR